MAVNMYNVNMTKHIDREPVIEENKHIVLHIWVDFVGCHLISNNEIIYNLGVSPSLVSRYIPLYFPKKSSKTMKK